MSSISTETNVPERILILLESTEENEILLRLLKSPLGLVKIIVGLLFNKNGLLLIHNNLDSIKRMAAGLGSAELKSDVLARYSIDLFSFNQFVHSSFRARQGNLLEEVLRHVLKQTNVTTYEKNQHKELIESLGIKFENEHDVDVLASNGNQFLMIQIRSRDDTGGTTAKGSLAELLKEIIHNKQNINSKILYVIYVWEPLQEAQKRSLITKCITSLGLEKLKEKKEDLEKEELIKIDEKIDFQIVYGSNNLIQTLKKFTNKAEIDFFDNLIKKIYKWDDFWLAYSIASLELINLFIYGYSNPEILNELLEKENIIVGNTLTECCLKARSYIQENKDYLNYSYSLAKRIINNWPQKPSIIKVDLNYLRDLILLYMIYEKYYLECEGYLKKFLNRAKQK